VYLIDTNIISEMRKGNKANQGVQTFWQAADIDSFYLPVQTIGEIRYGIESIKGRGDLTQAQLLDRWLDHIITEFAERILAFDEDCAQVWGRLMSPGKHHPIDKQIASIALINRLMVVTRNTKDFEGTGVKTLNPFL
jgi:predicted nucleic acid-binding protein